MGNNGHVYEILIFYINIRYEDGQERIHYPGDGGGGGCGGAAVTYILHSMNNCSLPPSPAQLLTSGVVTDVGSLNRDDTGSMQTP